MVLAFLREIKSLKKEAKMVLAFLRKINLDDNYILSLLEIAISFI